MSETSGFIRVSLGRRLAAELDARAARGELVWNVGLDSGRLAYAVAPAPAAEGLVMRMTPGECADWLGLDVMS